MRILPLMLLVVCCTASAEWLSMGKSDTSERFIDLDNVIKSGQFRRVWSLSNYFERDAKYYFLSTRAYSEYDCDEPRSRVLQEEFWSEYQAKGIILQNPFQYPRTWQFHAPNTFGYTTFQLVCSK